MGQVFMEVAGIQTLTNKTSFPSIYSRANGFRMTEKPPTHDAYALRRESRHRSRYLEVGHAHIKAHCPHCNVEIPVIGVHKVSLNRLPTGGFSWDFYLSPAGHKPPEPEPERPSGEDAY
jgi:hypothetical protein